VVYLSGAGGNKATVAKAQANAESTSANTYGIVQNDIADNNNGYVVLAGIISNIDTSAFVAGTMLYLSPTTAGGYTSTKPSAPNHLVYIGVVAYQHVNQGTIQMKLQNGYELDELHNVAISSVANNDLLVYESATSLWKNKSFATLGLATLSSPTFTGDPKAPTPATGDNDTSIATTAFVKAQGYITSSALSPYLLTTTAAAVYQTISGMSAYLTTTAAAGTYLTITDAASTYQTLAGMVDYLTTASASDTYYLQSNPSGYIPDAPSDSATYGRNNGSWVAVGGGGSVNWGSIGGTLSDQTDLWTVLGGKADLTGSSFTGTQYFAGSWGQVQIGDSASGIAIYDGSYSTYVGVTSSGIHFADGTSQTTAATAGANFGDVFAMGIVKDVTWTGMGWLLTCDPINSYMNAAGGMAVVSFDGSKFEWMSGMSTTSTWTYLTSTFGSTDYVYIQCFSQKSQNPVNYV
jgi:hypothetical protein